MYYINGDNPDKLILIRKNQIKEPELIKYYGESFIAIDTPEGNANLKKEFIKSLKEQIPESIKCILVADTDMFKSLAKVKKVTGLDGYPVNTEFNIPAFIVPNYISILYNPEQKKRLQFIKTKITEYLSDRYQYIGKDIIVKAVHPNNIIEVKEFLNSLHEYPVITVDIETAVNNTMGLEGKELKEAGLALHHYANRLYSIGLAWNEHEGGSFIYHRDYKDLLVKFFNEYKGTLLFFNAGFDVTQLIYHLYMSGLEDYQGLLTGLHTLCDKTEDAYLVSYLALNSIGNTALDLKSLSHEYTGNYAEDVTDVTKVPIPDLLTYNLKDVLATWYVYKKYYPKMVQDNQEELYKQLFLPSLKVLIETQLVGLRLYPDRLNPLAKTLDNIQDNHLNAITESDIIKKYNIKLQYDACTKYNKEHKKQRVVSDFADLVFNPRSHIQLGDLLYNFMGLPVLNTTKKGNPATDGDTLNDLLNLMQDKSVKDLLQNIIDFSMVDKITSSFIPSFMRAPYINGMKGLYGNFRLGGTVSGRLSSNSPNLQQIPSTGSPYAKPVKEVFGAPKGYVFVSADQRSLEDRIAALTSKDPNKVRVYTEGYDGHCLRAYAYFKEQMPDIKLAEEGDEVYKVTHDDGTVEYCTAERLRLLNDNKPEEN